MHCPMHLYLPCTQQEVGTREQTLLKTDKSQLEDKIEMLETEKSDMLAECGKFETQVMGLEEKLWKLRVLQVNFACFESFLLMSVNA